LTDANDCATLLWIFITHCRATVKSFLAWFCSVHFSVAFLSAPSAMAHL
jgi:hypothetical protein